jgi:hypothetical protein
MLGAIPRHRPIATSTLDQPLADRPVSVPVDEILDGGEAFGSQCPISPGGQVHEVRPVRLSW